MIPVLLVLELALRGAAAGVLAATGIAFLRGDANRSLRVSGALFSAAIASYALISSPALSGALGSFRLAALVPALGGVGYCWLFVITLFEDRPLSWPRFAPAVTLTLLGLIGVLIEPPAMGLVVIAHNLLEIAITLHALCVIYRGFRGDLVEARRRLRGPFMAVVAVYAVTVSAVEIGESLGVGAPWYGLAGAVALAVLSLSGSVVFLGTRAAAFGCNHGSQ